MALGRWIRATSGIERSGSLRSIFLENERIPPEFALYAPRQCGGPNNMNPYGA
jgi:hypothetical protein